MYYDVLLYFRKSRVGSNLFVLLHSHLELGFQFKAIIKSTSSDRLELVAHLNLVYSSTGSATSTSATIYYTLICQCQLYIFITLFIERVCYVSGLMTNR